MCQFEGDVVNSLYDAFLISWAKEIPNPPGLPCLSSPAAANREFFFGKRHAYVENKSADPRAPRADSSSMRDCLDDSAAGEVNKENELANISEQGGSSKKAGQEAQSAERRQPMENDDYTYRAQHAKDPAHAIFIESKRYDKENHAATAQSVNDRLNVEEKAEQTEFEFETDFAPFFMHSPHKPVPMALVNRQPQAIPGHHDLRNPQNAAWLQGFLYLLG